MGRLSGQRILHSEQRVIGDELAQHLLLASKQKALVEFLALQTGLVYGLCLAGLAEQRELPGRLGLPVGKDGARNGLLVF